jgi:hypothetical protein
MTSIARNAVQREVLKYVSSNAAPVRIGTLAENLKRNHADLRDLRDSEIRSVVQPMIVTGKLSYAPGLKIRLGK